MRPKISDLRILGLQFESTIVIFEISVLEFVLLQSLVQKQKSLNLVPKMPYFDFLGWNLKIILSYLKSAPSNLSNCKISRKNKMLKFGTKNVYLRIFGLEFLNTIVIFKIGTL